MPAQTISMDGYNYHFHTIEWKGIVEKLPEQVHSEYDRLHVWYGYSNRAEVEKFRWNPATQQLEHYNVPTEVWSSELRDTVYLICVTALENEKKRLAEQEEAVLKNLQNLANEASPGAIHTNENETTLGQPPVYGGVVLADNNDFSLYEYLQDFVKYQLKETDYVFNSDLDLTEDHLKWYTAIRSFWRKANYLIDKENIIPFCASVERANHPNDPLLVIPTAISCKLHTKILFQTMRSYYPKIWNAFETADLSKIADLTNVWAQMALGYNREELAWAYFPQAEFMMYVAPLHDEIEKRDGFMSKEEMLEFYNNNIDAMAERMKTIDFLSMMPMYEDLISITPVENMPTKMLNFYKWVKEGLTGA